MRKKWFSLCMPSLHLYAAGALLTCVAKSSTMARDSSVKKSLSVTTSYWFCLCGAPWLKVSSGDTLCSSVNRSVSFDSIASQHQIYIFTNWMKTSRVEFVSTRTIGFLHLNDYEIDFGRILYLGFCPSLLTTLVNEERRALPLPLSFLWCSQPSQASYSAAQCWEQW